MAFAVPRLIVLLAAYHLACGAQPALVPRPQQIEPCAGNWTLEEAVRVVASAGAAEEAGKLAVALGVATGFHLPVGAGPARAGDIALLLEAAREELGEEGYELRVAPEGVTIAARRAAGLFYGGQTLRQLLPAAAWRRAPAVGIRWAAPCVRILDRPRFAWRGMLLDPARHFLPKPAVLAMLDAMAMHKLNRLQLHLTDDQGWRIEIPSFPRLTARSAWREGTLIGHGGERPERYSNIAHGGYYSREDAREIVAYAAARHIVVVPEVEMPGHARAWLAAYPEFAVFPDRAAGLEVWKRWGVSRDVLAPRPATLDACRRILDELCEMFPSPWIHTGGDEAPRDQWRESLEMQEIIRTLGLRDEDGLQAYFTGEMSRYLEAKGRRLVGWDEILEGAELGGGGKTALAPGAVVMSWRGEKGGQAAALAGHDAIMAPNTWTYLDYYQGPPGEEPLAIGGSISLARAYAFEPVSASLPQAAARRILGGQMQLWSEYLPGADSVFYMAFPRAAALAEVFWSPGEGKELADLLGRLEEHEARLRAAGVVHRALARRTCLPDGSGRLLAEARDAVTHGARTADPYSMLSWRVELKAVPYRVRVLAPQPEVQAWMGGELVREVFRPRRAGPHLLFLRGGQGVELLPEP